MAVFSRGIRPDRGGLRRHLITKATPSAANLTSVLCFSCSGKRGFTQETGSEWPRSSQSSRINEIDEGLLELSRRMRMAK